MKLRNKKTGEAVYVDFQIPLSNNKEVVCAYSITSLKELNERFEDYKPTEPLIKDEKIRKAVRAWAEVNYIHDVYFKDDGVTTFIGGDYEQISFNPWRQSGLEEGKLYTIEELCGSEE